MFLERMLGVSVFSSLFMWGGISPVENDLEWQSERKRHQKWVFLRRQSLTLPKIYLVWRSSVLFLSLIENCLFSLFTSFQSLIGNPSFSFFFSFSLFSSFSFSYFPFLPFLSFYFSFPIPFFGKSGFSILFALPCGDSTVLCFGGKNEDSFL